MAKFNFSLQGFLELKQKLEDQEKLKYGEALAALEIERQKFNALQTDEKNQIESLKLSIQKSALNPREIDEYYRYLDWLRNKISIQENEVSAASENAEQMRVNLVAAMKERKTLETLKDKAHQEYLREEQLAEQKIVDEIVSYQYHS
jgi:flagellar FliJ protein